MPEIITSDDAQYALDIVKRICVQVGPGLPGTFQERERTGIIKIDLESHLGAENVFVEEFTLAPGAFLGTYPLSALFMLMAALLNISIGRFSGISPWVTSIAALALSIIFSSSIGFEPQPVNIADATIAKSIVGKKIVVFIIASLPKG